MHYLPPGAEGLALGRPAAMTSGVADHLHLMKDSFF
jgi:hypothetical protein